MSDTAPPDSCVEPTPFCCPDDLKDLGLVQDDQNHRVWSFANLEELLRVLNYVRQRIGGAHPIRLSGFFMMNANPMMRSSNISYRDILLDVVNAEYEGTAKDRNIITGTAEVAREIVSNPELCDPMLMAEKISSKQDILAVTNALAIVRRAIEDLKMQIKHPPRHLCGGELQAQKKTLGFQLTSKVAEEERLSLQEEKDYEDRIDQYVEKCDRFLKELYSVAADRSVTVTNVHAASQIPFFLFALQRAAGESEPRSVVVQAFLDTRNLASVVDEGDAARSMPSGSAEADVTSGAFKLPGALSLDPTYNNLLLELTAKLARRFDKDNALLRPGQDRQVTLLTFAFERLERSGESIFAFRDWLFGAARSISLRRLRAGGLNRVALEVIPLPLNNGLALALLGGIDESSEVGVARLIRAVTFAWRLLAEKAGSADALHQGFKLSASVHATRETLIWAPNGCVTIAGAALTTGIAPTCGCRAVDGRLFLHDEDFKALSEEYNGLQSVFSEPASSDGGSPGEWRSTDISAAFVVVAVFPVAAQADATGPAAPEWFEQFCPPLESIADPRSARWYGPANLQAWALCLLPPPTAAAGAPKDDLIRRVLDACFKLAAKLSASSEQAVKPFGVAIFCEREQFLPPHLGSRILGAAVTRRVEELRALPDLDSDHDFLIVPEELKERLGDNIEAFESINGWLVQRQLPDLARLNAVDRAVCSKQKKRQFAKTLSKAFRRQDLDTLLLANFNKRFDEISQKAS